MHNFIFTLKNYYFISSLKMGSTECSPSDKIPDGISCLTAI